MLAVISNKHDSFFKVLFTSKYLDINAVNFEGDTALMLAAKHNNLEACKWLIKAKANIEIKNILGEDAIKLAHNSSSELINLLVTYKNSESNKALVANNSSNTINNKGNMLQKQNTLKGVNKKKE